MHKLPIISGKETIKFLTRNGFESKRQKGSHVFMKHTDGRRTTVPLDHELDRGTLKGILEQSGLREKFEEEYSRGE